MNQVLTAETQREIDRRFAERFLEGTKRVDKVFAGLMTFQCVASIIAAIWLTPTSWAGSEAKIHFHVWFSIGFGILLALPTALLGYYHPGAKFNRYAFAVAQMLFSSLIIHISGGRIESHFHIFGSIAFLAAYRDWKVILVATAVTAIDHIGRGLMWPGSLFGVDTVSLWRPLEHAGWLLFEVFVVLLNVRHNRAETYALAEQEVAAEVNQTRMLTSELKKLSGAITAAGRGDFTVEVETSHVAETEVLNTELRRMFSELRQTIAALGKSTATVRSRADNLAQRSTEIRQAVHEQRDVMDSINHATHSLHAIIEEIQKSVNAASEAKTQANQQAKMSEAAIVESERSMAALLSSATRIDAIVEEIREIAEQTSLLSLNATIEAARAGESGKGFAVVASEVKELAKKSNDAAASIAELIQESLRCVNTGVETSRETTEQLRKIISAVQTIDRQITEVATSAAEQAEKTRHVESLVEQVLVAADLSTQSCEQIVQESDQFRLFAQELDQRVQQFKVAEKGSGAFLA
jgi:methyl-accepting chemotaxis protein